MQMTNTFEVARYSADLQNRIHHMPIGDPLSGPAYGEMLKSKGIGMVLGVVASVVTMGAAVPMLAATALATQIAGGVMMAGGVMSGVGAVTGNKKLAKIGGIMSLAGGIGGLVAGGMSSTAQAGSMFAPGSGSEAVSKMAGNFMESVNSVTGASGLGIGDVYNADAAANAASGADFQKAGTIEMPSGESASAPNLEDPNPGGMLNKASDASAGQLSVTGAEPPVQAATAPASNQSAVSSQIDPANISNTPTPEWSAQVANSPASGGIETAADKAARIAAEEAKKKAGETIFGMNKTELMKTGAGMLEKAAAAGFSPDQQAELDAKTALYGAQSAYYNTKTEVDQYKLNNSKKQVVMISADDPGMDIKIKDAASKGHEVAFIPAIGAGGVKPVSGQSWAAKIPTMTPQTPVRQGVFNKATA